MAPQQSQILQGKSKKDAPTVFDDYRTGASTRQEKQNFRICHARRELGDGQEPKDIPPWKKSQKVEFEEKKEEDVKVFDWRFEDRLNGDPEMWVNPNLKRAGGNPREGYYLRTDKKASPPRGKKSSPPFFT